MAANSTLSNTNHQHFFLCYHLIQHKDCVGKGVEQNSSTFSLS